MPNKKLCFLVSSSERSEEKKGYCLSTSVPVFLLSPLLSGLVFVKYPDWNPEGEKNYSRYAIMHKTPPKNLGGINVRETEDIASSKQNFWTQGYDIA